MPRVLWCLLVFLVLASAAGAQPVTLDDFESLDGWKVIASDGVAASIALDVGAPVNSGAAAGAGAAGGSNGAAGPGRSLRLDFDFQAGAGFCVLRRAVALDLPANYRFTFRVRGAGPANNFECKLVDPSGDNVWWVNRRGFEFPADWTKISYRARHFSFAWGPMGPKRFERVGFIEFAVAASTGGKGSIWLDALTFEPLPETVAAAGVPTVIPSSNKFSPHGAVSAVPIEHNLAMCTRPDDPQPAFTIDLLQMRELGGLVLEWNPRDFPIDYDIKASTDEGDQPKWETVAKVRGGNGRRDDVRIPDGEARRMRIEVLKVSGDGGVGLQGLTIKDTAYGATPDAMYADLAAASRRGNFPRSTLKEQPYWTVVGAMGDTNEALLSADGALEVDFQGFTIEPFIVLSQPGLAPFRLISWADVRLAHALDEGDLPIPTTTWEADGLRLDITAFAAGPAQRSSVVARYLLTNTGPAPVKGRVALAIRPFQVLPPWQDLRISGGVSPIGRIARTGDAVVIDGKKAIHLLTAPASFTATTFAGGDITEYLARADMPAAWDVTDPDRLASAAMIYEFDLAPSKTWATALEVPFHADPAEFAGFALSSPTPPADVLRIVSDRRAVAAHAWRAELDKVGLTVPPAAGRLAAAFRTAQAHILINADGPAIQPGSRTYERSWIRDGCLTGTALLFTGHADQFRRFIDWYAGFQYPSGKIPCVVDARGPDPVPEHDSTGQFLYAVDAYHRFTRDDQFLKTHFAQVKLAVEYLQSLRAQRMTAEYAPGPGSTAEKRAEYGLVPESISHEGYSAKPMHSYWDDFFTLRGLEAAARVAGVVGQPELAKQWGQLGDDFRGTLYNSIRAATAMNGIDYVPGCVELGDFDAPSTAIAVFPCGQLGAAPEPLLSNTFERWYQFFTGRIDGSIAYREYSPYETRLMGTFVRLGWRDRAQELLKFYLADQRPSEWNQWAEVVWREPSTPRFIGDMPHTWVASDFVSAVRSMFVYERERDDALVIAGGVPGAWLDAGGVGVRDFPTPYGKLSYRLRREAAGDGGGGGAESKVVLEFDGLERVPGGGIVVDLPDIGEVRGIDVSGQGVGDLVYPIVLRSGARARVEIMCGSK